MTNEPPTEDLIRYDVMVQEALIGVVRKVLIEASRVGLPGEHHFYITFRSHAPGVRLSTRLREKYPEEMTIVLQHQFWDLNVTEQLLEVGLSFGGIAEKLVVPFEALTGFYDPSVQFGLKFTPDEAQADNDLGGEPAAETVKDKLDAIATLEKPGKGRKTKARASETEPGKIEALPSALGKLREDKLSDSKLGVSSPAEEQAAGTSEPKNSEPKPEGGAQVVSLEAFRKKK